MPEQETQIKQLLTEILANQQSLHEAFSAVHDRLNEIEGDLRTIVRDHEFMTAHQDEEGDDDILFHIAREVVVTEGRASTSFFQRKFNIGYSRAARLIDLLEVAGVISIANGVIPREVLLTVKDLEQLNSTEDELEKEA